LNALDQLATVYRELGRLDEAIKIRNEILTKRKRDLGMEHDNTLKAMTDLAGDYGQQRQWPPAVALFAQVLDIRNRRLGGEHPETLTAGSHLARGLLHVHKFGEAETLLREMVRVRTNNSPDSWQLAFDRLQLGEALTGLKRFKEAAPLLLEAYASLQQHWRAIPGDAQSRTRIAGGRLVQIYKTLGDTSEAAQWQEKLKVFATTAPTTTAPAKK
jgi:eukaryotic-like serine/threonine-protein kinase